MTFAFHVTHAQAKILLEYRDGRTFTTGHYSHSTLGNGQALEKTLRSLIKRGLVIKVGLSKKEKDDWGIYEKFRLTKDGKDLARIVDKNTSDRAIDNFAKKIA